MRFFLEFSYSGKNYHGWQRQPNAVSVQEVIEDSLNTILSKVIVHLLNSANSKQEDLWIGQYNGTG